MSGVHWCMSDQTIRDNEVNNAFRKKEKNVSMSSYCCTKRGMEKTWPYYLTFCILLVASVQLWNLQRGPSPPAMLSQPDQRNIPRISITGLYVVDGGTAPTLPTNFQEEQLTIRPREKYPSNKENMDYSDKKSLTSALLAMWDSLPSGKETSNPYRQLRYVSKPYALPAPQQHRIPQDAVTAAIHASMGKINRLLYLIQRWGGPTSTSIYLKSHDDINEFVDFYITHAETVLRYTDIHIMMEDTSQNSLEYPHNLLRNMALQELSTDYYLALDVDFCTPPKAATTLYNLIRQDDNIRMRLQNKTLMVLPAFETNLKTKVDENNVFEIAGQVLPTNREEVIQMWDEGKIEPFHVKKFKNGHAPTKYFKWYYNFGEGASCYMIKYMQGFEPYVVGYKRDIELPSYWNAFRGYGYNKRTWFTEAHFMGFKYAVLRDYFVVHLDHSYSNRVVTGQTMKELDNFRNYMVAKYDLGPSDMILLL